MSNISRIDNNKSRRTTKDKQTNLWKQNSYDLGQNLVVNAKTRDLRLLDIKKKFIESTHVQCVEFAEMTQTNKVNFREHGPGSSSINLERGLELVNEWEILINEMNSKKKELLESQDLFGLDLSSYPELNIIETEMKDLKHIYSVYES